MDFKTLLEQITALFQSLTTKQKAIIGASTVSVIGFIVFLVLYTNAKNGTLDGYRVLFDNISASDSALVIEQLEKDNVPYKILNEGTIKVPKDFVYKERITIAALGIPKNSKVGFELFDKQDFGETDFAQKIKYLRALEGELARTIGSLTPIEDAKVHIALPKESVFVEKATMPTASVILNINPNMKLSNKQIIGIKNLIAASVTKLSTENVKIVNQEGEPLGTQTDDGFESDLVLAQIKYKSDYERAYEKKIEKVLAPILGGLDKVVAKVTIDFDFEQRDTVSEFYDPESVVRSEQSTEESKEGGSTKESGGVPGAISNIGPVQGVENDKKEGEKYEKSSTTTNYEISKKVTNIKGEFAKIRRITASVVIDGKYIPKKDEEGNPLQELEYVALEGSEIEAITNIVKNSFGYSQKRGDEVAVSNFEFNPISAQKPKDMAENISNIATNYINPFLPLLKYLMAGLLLFIFYRKIIIPFGERMLEEYNVEEEMIDEIEIEEDQEDTDAMKEYNEAKKKAEEELGIKSGMDEEELKHEVLLQKIRSEIEQNPEDAAKLLKSIVENDKEF
ncbi:MAG TPA: flagellar basal body M-ring protein FliF [Campylobacterales bacterium]|nr:flagellar basal body M-ring protein FliF [Campylobacterales bacterium]